MKRSKKKSNWKTQPHRAVPGAISQTFPLLSFHARFGHCEWLQYLQWQLGTNCPCFSPLAVLLSTKPYNVQNKKLRCAKFCPGAMLAHKKVASNSGVFAEFSDLCRKTKNSRGIKVVHSMFQEHAADSLYKSSEVFCTRCNAPTWPKQITQKIWWRYNHTHSYSYVYSTHFYSTSYHINQKYQSEVRHGVSSLCFLQTNLTNWKFCAWSVKRSAYHHISIRVCPWRVNPWGNLKSGTLASHEYLWMWMWMDCNLPITKPWLNSRKRVEPTRPQGISSAQAHHKRANKTIHWHQDRLVWGSNRPKLIWWALCQTVDCFEHESELRSFGLLPWHGKREEPTHWSTVDEGSQSAKKLCFQVGAVLPALLWGCF